MNDDQALTLIALARQAIAKRLGIGSSTPEIEKSDWLNHTAASFVTLTLDGRLRGCIGTLESHRSLIDDVQANAIAAAFYDPRFPALSADEFRGLKIEISLLSAMQPLAVSSESDALAAIRPGIDGVVLAYGFHKGTFLPQVWEQLPEPVQFMAQLKLKAGLSADFWHPDVRLFVYQVEKIKEAGAS